MRTKHKNITNKQEKEKKSSFWEFMGGEFLVKKSVMRWYPYIVLLFILAAISVFNEKSVNKKVKEINKLDMERKAALSELRISNQYISYDTNQKITEILQEQGYVKNDKSIYKIIIKTNNSENEND